MPKSVSDKEAGERFAELVDAILADGDPYIVEKDGRPAAALVSMDTYQIITRNRDEFRRFLNELWAKVDERDEAETEAIIQEAVQAVRRG
ncbi:MAG: type II toxin-antitoxin system Phd/YefM family antitoxin [Deltaproteobacteria bacterium]|nr:type II toxin-antitoxin system Phd/YefM family antitoxin [Deltaproteobacteria bacterium]MCB9488773.1 type II toxin-antitoxin system Phd/YefM family antitoxin [Deltaproteobacteria bacterium]